MCKPTKHIEVIKFRDLKQQQKKNQLATHVFLPLKLLNSQRLNNNKGRSKI